MWVACTHISFANEININTPLIKHHTCTCTLMTLLSLLITTKYTHIYIYHANTSKQAWTIAQSHQRRRFAPVPRLRDLALPFSDGVLPKNHCSALTNYSSRDSTTWPASVSLCLSCLAACCCCCSRVNSCSSRSLASLVSITTPIITHWLFYGWSTERIGIRLYRVDVPRKLYMSN